MLYSEGHIRQILCSDDYADFMARYEDLSGKVMEPAAVRLEEYEGEIERLRGRIADVVRLLVGGGVCLIRFDWALVIELLVY